MQEYIVYEYMLLSVLAKKQHTRTRCEYHNTIMIHTRDMCANVMLFVIAECCSRTARAVGAGITTLCLGGEGVATIPTCASGAKKTCREAHIRTP